MQLYVGPLLISQKGSLTYFLLFNLSFPSFFFFLTSSLIHHSRQIISFILSFLTTMKVPTLHLFLGACIGLLYSPSSLAATSQKPYETNYARRERNLDHWDAETLAAYLGLHPETAEVLPDAEKRYVGIDASVMFYAQWCKNCHKFAPIWDTIGTLMGAGTTQSNMVMALFNCELNTQHTKLCDAAGVTHYPTLMFIGSGPFVDSDPVSSFVLGGKDKSAGPYGPTKLKRTVKFQGDLNLGDSVLDWLRTMQGLSKWHQWGQNHDYVLLGPLPL